MIAFLVVSHRNPSQVLRLVRALAEGRATRVLVHFGLEVEWGNVAYADMLLLALSELRERLDPDWVAVLSGQDYPLRPLREFERHLADSPHHALLGDAWELDMSTEPTPPQLEFYRRYRYHHYDLPQPLAELLARRPVFGRALARAAGGRAYLRELPGGIRPSLGVRTARHPFGPTLPCHVSSDWLTLERRGVHAVLDFARARPDVMRHYRRTIIPSESLFATALAHDPGISLGAASRIVGFEPGAPHPQTFRAADVERLRASGMHFARKFDERVDARALDLLDEARNPPG